MINDGRTRRLLRASFALLAVLAVLPAMLVLLSAGAVSAASGDVLQRYTLDLSGTACVVSGEPTTPVGIVVQGTKLRVSCWSDHTVSTFDVRTGVLIGSPKVISGISLLGALTYNKAAKKLYGCADGGLVGIVNVKAGTFTTVFEAACVDGLMWDPIDNTFWAGGDAAPTIEHYMADGTLISSTDITALLGGCNRTGIEAVGGQLMIATVDCGPIYSVTRALDSATPFVSPDPAFVEDMACDSKTFKSSNKTALWVVHPYDTEVVAYETPSSGPKRPACK